MQATSIDLPEGRIEVAPGTRFTLGNVAERYQDLEQ